MVITFGILLNNDFDKVRRVLFNWKNNSSLSPQHHRHIFKSLRKMESDIYSVARKKENKIAELQRMADFRKEFIANISHELKTPLFSAQGFVHTLLDGAVRDKNVRSKFLKKAAKNLDGLDILVQDLLTISQIEIGEIRMHKEYFDMQVLTEEVFDQLDELAEKKDISLKVIPKDEPILVYADYQRMRQVMMNLVNNAIKYNSDKGKVIVRYTINKDTILVEVEDNGEGIPEEDIDRIFERFYRVDKSRSKKKGGTGLGLAIVNHIIKGHNSKISVVSEYGKGSKFYFELPRDK